MLEDATGLRTTGHSCTNWIGLGCSSVSSTITTMRQMIASNNLCPREETAIFPSLNPASDPQGAHGTRGCATPWSKRIAAPLCSKRRLRVGVGFGLDGLAIGRNGEPLPLRSFLLDVFMLCLNAGESILA
jgi:hypothetical protein